MILSWIGCAESYADNANSSSIFFKKSMRNLKFCKKAAMLGRKIYIYLQVLIPANLCHFSLLLSEQNVALENYCIDLLNGF